MHESVHTLSSSVSPAQVIEALQQQRSRHEVLCLLLEAEQSAHRHTHHLLAALGAELDQWDTDVQERTVSIEMLVIGVAEGCSLAAQIDVKSWREVTIACTELKVWGSGGRCVGECKRLVCGSARLVWGSGGLVCGSILDWQLRKPSRTLPFSQETSLGLLFLQVTPLHLVSTALLQVCVCLCVQ